jgi:P27 family predicted phage terminase small subunit
MSKGRKKIPDQIKTLRGTDQPCRMNGNTNTEPISDISAIVNTGQLRILKTASAKKIFKEKANQLIQLKNLTEMDLEQLAIYANNLDELFNCMKELKKGKFREQYDENGLIVRFVENPYLKLYKDLQPLIAKTASEFGFTPVSRMKFSTHSEEKDPLTELMKAFK